MLTTRLSTVGCYHFSDTVAADRLISSCRRPGHFSNHLIWSALGFLLLSYAAGSIMVAIHHRGELS
jgi:hypothetical protein